MIVAPKGVCRECGRSSDDDPFHIRRDRVNANAPGYDAPTPEHFYEQQIADLRAQLAAKDAEIERMRPVVEAAIAYWTVNTNPR